MTGELNVIQPPGISQYVKEAVQRMVINIYNIIRTYIKGVRIAEGDKRG